MHIAVFQLAELLKSQVGQRICRCGNSKGNEDFVRMQARIAVAERINFQPLDWFDDAWRNQRNIVIDLCQ